MGGGLRKCGRVSEGVGMDWEGVEEGVGVAEGRWLGVLEVFLR